MRAVATSSTPTTVLQTSTTTSSLLLEQCLDTTSATVPVNGWGLLRLRQRPAFLSFPILPVDTSIWFLVWWRAKVSFITASTSY